MSSKLSILTVPAVCRAAVSAPLISFVTRLCDFQQQIKNHCFVFVNALIENPTFDSQTKENMTLQAKKFGSKCELSDKFHKAVSLATCNSNL